jgi:hypothetical protein
MSGEIKKLKRSEGVAVSEPDDLDIGGGGGGGEGINYITQTDFSTYADAAGDQPVNGAGGSPSIVVTENDTSPLIGSSDIKMAKDGANRQGEGVAWDFTPDRTFRDNPKLFKVSFYYRVTANFDYGDFAAPANDPSDIVVYLISDPDGTPTVIQPSTFTLSGAGLYEGTFQVEKDTTTYRLCAHIATTNASAYDIYFDQVSVGPQSKVYGPPVTDRTQFTPTFNNWADVTSENGYWWRIGQHMHIEIDAVSGPAGPTGDLEINMPTGFSIDTAKLADVTIFRRGSATATQSGSGNAHIGSVQILNASTFRILGDDGSALWNATVPWDWDSTNNTFTMTVDVPIVGWSSNTLLSSEGETRVVAAAGRKTANQTGITTTTILTFNAIDDDSHSAISSSVFTAPVSGRYRIEGHAVWQTGGFIANEYAEMFVMKNTSTQLCRVREPFVAASSAFWTTDIEWQGYLNTGDTLQINVAKNGAGSATIDGVNDQTWTRFSVHRLSGPSAIAASEVIAARLYGSTLDSDIASSAVAFIKFDTIEYDTHGMVTQLGATGTGSSNGTQITAKVAGFYEIKSSVAINLSAGSPTEGDFYWARIQKNSTTPASGLFYRRGTERAVNTDNDQYYPFTSDTIYMNVGDQIKISASAENASAVVVGDASRQLHYLTVKRVGGVM